jgi:branched-chain amino acid transport system substrate-binding protein
MVIIIRQLLLHFILWVSIGPVLGFTSNLNHYSKHKIPSADTITIGLLVENIHKGKDVTQAARLAIDSHNQGQPPPDNIFKLAIRFTDGPWGQAANRTVELIYQENAVALVGSLDGRTAHLVEQVTAKSHIPYLETKATDPTLSKAFVPWFFRLVPNDDQIAGAIVGNIYEEMGYSRVAVITDNTYDSNKARAAVIRKVADLSVANPNYYTLDNTDTGLAQLMPQLNAANCEAIVVLSKIKDLTLFSELSEAKIYIHAPQPSFSLVNPRQKVYAIDVVGNHSKYELFAGQFINQAGTEPSPEAVYVFDAFNLLINTINEGGTANGAIGNNLSNMGAYKGISGKISFDSHGNLKQLTRLVKIN